MKKQINNALRAAVAAFALVSTANAVEAEKESLVCPQDTEHAKNLASYKNSIKKQVEGQLSLEVDLDGNPLLYDNPDAGCDLGFSMPGLPDIGLGLDGINACELLKSVTGDMVKAVNKEMQDTVDQAIVDITGVEDLDFEFEMDLEDVAADEINKELESSGANDKIYEEIDITDR